MAIADREQRYIRQSSSRSSREVCRAWPALNSAALVSWTKSEDLGMIRLFASRCSCSPASAQPRQPVLLDGRWAKNHVNVDRGKSDSAGHCAVR